MEKFKKFMDDFEGNIIGWLLPLMCAVVFIATFGRYTKLFMLSWGDELARYLMIWIVFIGIGAAARTGEHFAVTAFVNKMPRPVQKALIVVQSVIVAAFCAFVTYWMVFIMNKQVAMGQKSPSLHWPMWLMYASVAIGCVLMMVRYCIHGFHLLKTFDDETAAIQDSSQEGDDAL